MKWDGAFGCPGLVWFYAGTELVWSPVGGSLLLLVINSSMQRIGKCQLVHLQLLTHPFVPKAKRRASNPGALVFHVFVCVAMWF
ncbi:unnamed protein product [Urochloa humidicola]